MDETQYKEGDVNNGLRLLPDGTWGDNTPVAQSYGNTPYTTPGNSLYQPPATLPPYTPGPITSDSLKPTTPIDYQTPKPEFIPDVSTFVPSAPETKASDLSTRLQELNQGLVGESAYRSGQEGAQGILGLEKTQNDLTSQLNALVNEAKAIPIQLQKEFQGRGATVGGVAPLERGRLRDNAIEALTVSSLLEASRGNLAFAQKQVDRAVKAKYDPIREQIAVATANLELIIKSPEYTLAEKKRAEAQKQIQDAKSAALKKEEDNAKNIYNIALKAAENGADALTLQNIQKATTPEEAIAAAGGSLNTTETWSAPYSRGGDIVQKNSKTGEIRTAVNVASGRSSSGSDRFTTTQLNNGAANIGMSIEEFESLSPDDQNFAINNSSLINSDKDAIREAIEEGKDLAEVIQKIQMDDLTPQAVKQSYVNYAGSVHRTSAPEPGLFKRIKNFFAGI